MLKSLNIENIAVIEKCNIDFCNGFNVLTGETGAGKSIVIDAINAVTGQRTSKELIRSGCDKASVSAYFDSLSDSVLDFIKEYSIDVDDGTLMMLRTINSDGKNVCKINGITVNVSVLKQLGALLVNIHGQHDNQALLDPASHLSFIDSYGNFSDLVNDYRISYTKLKDIRKKLKALNIDEFEKNRKLELLKFQINEIELANITVGEREKLIEQRNLIRNAEKIRLNLDACYNALAGDDNVNGAVTTVAEANNQLSVAIKLIKDSGSLFERLTAVSSELNDLTAEIRDLRDSVSFDQGELEKVEQRIDLINDLSKKYGGSEEAILEFLSNSIQETNDITTCDEIILKLEKESEILEDELILKAEKLTKIRKECAEKFSLEICSILKYLEMPNVIFSAKFEQGVYNKDGCDKVEFLISANSGQEPKPLKNIASGGELSRIMLAIKSVLYKATDADTLIFDEIDTGISGKAADKVGRQLKSLSKNNQVICVTHLAQIAAAGDNHLYISKSTNNNNTFTNVKAISNNERVEEIARIMTGNKITENLFASAKELLDSHN